MILDGIVIDGNDYFIGLGLLSVADAYILVVSEWVDELKILYLAGVFFFLDEFMHSPMIFLIIGSLISLGFIIIIEDEYLSQYHP